MSAPLQSKPKKTIEFEFYSLADPSKYETAVYELSIKQIEEGEFKGIQYFHPMIDRFAYTPKKVLPENFVFDIFMNLNASNIEELLAFQNKYGQIVPPIFDGGDASYMLEFDPISNVEKNEIGLTKRLNEYLESKGESVFPAVPVIETSRTVTMLQQLIEQTSNCRNDTFSYDDYLGAETFNRLANSIAKVDTPIFGFTKDNPSNTIHSVGLIDNIVLHHMKTLSIGTRKIWKCTRCNKYFQYERREPINPAGNHFCSPECSSRWHQQEYDRKKRESKKSRN